MREQQIPALSPMWAQKISLHLVLFAVTIGFGCADPLYPYLSNTTTYGSIATQWNQVAQLAVARNFSGPVGSAVTFFFLGQVRPVLYQERLSAHL